MAKENSIYEREQIIPFPEYIRFHPKLTWGQKAFLAEMTAMCQKGRVLVDRIKLPSYMGISQPTLINYLTHLVKLKLIQWYEEPTGGEYLDLIPD